MTGINMKTGIAAIFFILILMTEIASSQPINEADSLNYTYIGPIISAAYNKVEYTDWFGGSVPGASTETKKMSGYIASGGLTLNIFAYDFCGDIQIKYANNFLEDTFKYIEVSAAGKYFFYQVNDYISLGAGFGIYLEIPTPGAKQNGSAGVQLPFTFLVHTTRDTKLFMDVFCRYGSFGTGTDTKSISLGTNLGFVFKVGRV